MTATTEPAAATPAHASSSAVAPKPRSPRATVRTFLIAMSQNEDDPRRFDEAVSSLDLSVLPPDRRDVGRLAFALEFIPRSTSRRSERLGISPDSTTIVLEREHQAAAGIIPG
ncbi:hypothetical protein EP7_004766 [Isosphaeraceae bacterium EP7]